MESTLSKDDKQNQKKNNTMIRDESSLLVEEMKVTSIKNAC